MSFSSPKKSWSSLANYVLVATLGAVVLTGCSSLGDLWPSSEKQERDEKLAAIIFGEETGEEEVEVQVASDPDPADIVEQESSQVSEEVITPEDLSNVPLFLSDAELAQEGMLQFWEMITGGKSSSTFLDVVAGDRTIKFVRPVAVCVIRDLVYVVDMGLQGVYRYHRVSGELERVVDIRDIVAGDVADIYVTEDLSFYLTDTFGSRVLRFSHNGKLQREYKNRLNLVRPVSVTEDRITGSVIVADGEFDHVLVFNQQGDLYTSIGRRGEEPGEFLNITAMAFTDQEVYVASRVGGKIQVVSRDGEYLYSLEQDVMRFPLSLAVGNGRVYSSEYMDNTIKIFERGRLVESAGGTGVVPGKFKRITDLWLEDGFLFVVDSLNARIQVMKVTGNTSPIVNQ